MAMSLEQEGSGFPYFSRSVYQYLCGLSPTEINVTVDDVPNDDGIQSRIIEVFHST